MDERHPIDVAGNVRKDFRAPFAALAVLPEAKRRLHHRPDLIGEEAGVLVEAGERLPVALFELRLVVPRIDLACPAVQEEPNDGLGLGGEMPLVWREGIARIDRR